MVGRNPWKAVGKVRQRTCKGQCSANWHSIDERCRVRAPAGPPRHASSSAALAVERVGGQVPGRGGS
jgi:hypothetical protein